MLVDENDIQTGIEDKLAAHRKNLLHRSFSIFVFNPGGELLLQQRASGKYHSGGKWSNTCCSHPMPSESTIDAAHRRLMEEMGFDCNMVEVFSFVYRENVGNGLTEHEYDHVFVGIHEQDPSPDPGEAQSWKWMGRNEVLEDAAIRPDSYTGWSIRALNKLGKIDPQQISG